MKNVVGLLAFLSLASACSPGGTDSGEGDARVDFTRVTSELEPVEAPGIEKLHTVAGVFLAAQPEESGFQAAQDGGVRTVIDLRHPNETEFDERALVEALGLAYVSLPWNGEEELTDEIFARARELLATSEKPILLHCKSANRVGAVWLPHRVLDDGLSVEDALREARAVGLKAAAYEAKALDYIEREKP